MTHRTVRTSDAQAPTDQELVRRAQSDDDRAFGELVGRYESKVYSLSLRMLRNPEDAEDVLQDTFLRAYRGLKSFQGNSTFSTWIYRIATNSALMRLRKKRLPTVSIDQADEQEAPLEIADWKPGPVEQLMTEETREAMEQAIESLPPEFRQVFILRDVEELSNAEVAEVLDLSVAAVKSRLHRARLKVRNRLIAHFNERNAPRSTGARP